MYEEHPVFNPPPLDTVLWRYMDFTKYISLNENWGFIGKFVNRNYYGE